MYTQNGLEKSTCILASGTVGSADPTSLPTSIDNNQHPPSLPDKPYHPAATFSFPKRTFGVKKPVKCAARSQWFKTWSFLHYDEATDAVFCHICVAAVRQRKIKASHNVSNAFVS